jgi:hypothetical protein
MRGTLEQQVGDEHIRVARGAIASAERALTADPTPRPPTLGTRLRAM